MGNQFEDFKLKVFLSVARHGSFSLSARELGVSQPAVSQSIGTLEKSLGRKLFERRKGEVVLTDAGRSFLLYAQNIAYWYDCAERMFGNHGLSTPAGRPVRISADAVCANYILPAALAAIRANHAQIAFEVASGTGNPDVVMEALPSPVSIDFEREPLVIGVMEGALVASPRNGVMREAADSAGEGKPHFSTIAGVHVSNSFAVWDGYYGFLAPDLQARVAVRSSSLELLKAMVRESSRLVGILPEPAVRRDVLRGDLRQLPVCLPEVTFDIHFRQNPESASAEACGLIRDALQKK